jgi:hypothetical protein
MVSSESVPFPRQRLYLSLVLLIWTYKSPCGDNQCMPEVGLFPVLLLLDMVNDNI